MKLLLNAGFGYPLGAETLSALRARGFSGIRQDMLPSSDIPGLLAEIRDANLQPILLIKEPSLVFVRKVVTVVKASGLLAPDRPAPFIELIGEPDRAWAEAGGTGGAVGWGQFVALAAEEIRQVAPRVKVISGGITTTDKKRLDFLAKAEPYLPLGVIVGFHTYRTTQEPWVAWPGFGSRSGEMVRLKEIAGGRRLFNTEIGWHTAPSQVGGWLCNVLGIGCHTVQYTDADVALFAKWECEFTAAQGVDGLSWFQLNDGPDPNAYEHRFGIRRQDGVWKPVAESLRRFAEEQ